MNKKIYYILAVLLIAALCIVPLMMHPESEFGGADGEAEDLIGEIDPDYEPWFDNFWSPPGAETESLLFALQAALGSGVFFYFIGYFAAQNKAKHTQSALQQ